VEYIRRFWIQEGDIPALELALGYAVSIWTGELQRGQDARWRAFAIPAHSLRGSITRSTPDVIGRSVTAVDDVEGMLREVARTCERATPSIAAVAAVARHYADIAGAADPINECT
jgi:hypothetical protein